MAILEITRTNLGYGGWLLIATSDEERPTFYAYQEGLIFSENQSGLFYFNLEDGEELRVDIVDDQDDAPDLGFPGRAILQWDADADATSYRIDQYVDAAWAEIYSVQADTRSVYGWTSDYLDNLTSYSFRVVPIVSDNDGYPLEFTFYMHRRPDRPTVDDFAYDSGTGTVTATVSHS